MTDLTIRNATLRPCTPDMPVIEAGHVAVSGDRIASAGPGPGPEAQEETEQRGGMIELQ